MYLLSCRLRGRILLRSRQYFSMKKKSKIITLSLILADIFVRYEFMTHENFTKWVKCKQNRASITWISTALQTLYVVCQPLKKNIQIYFIENQSCHNFNLLRFYGIFKYCTAESASWTHRFAYYRTNGSNCWIFLYHNPKFCKLLLEINVLKKSWLKYFIC